MLQGCKVLDATERLGWLAGRLLADLGAEVTKLEAPHAELDGAEWRALNVNKRLLRLDPAGADGRERFESLARGADIVFCTPRPSDSPARLLDLSPRLVVVAITPFGLTGPKAGWLGSDLEIMAAGGAMSLAGEPDGMPVRVSAPQAYAWAGAQAAVGALVAIHHRAASGRGQLVDVSAQSAVIVALAHAPAFVDVAGITPTRAGAYMTGRSVTGAKFRVFWRCRDGYLNFILYGGGAGRRTNEQLVDWMRSRAFDLGPLAGIDWGRWDPTIVTQDRVDAIELALERFLATVTKREFLEEAHRREMLGYPVSTVADIASDPHLEARGFWQDLPGPDGRAERHCGAFVVVDGVRSPLVAAEAEAAPICGEGVKTGPQALEGVRIVEFGGYAAGPHIGKMLANFGATVIHVESRARPDGFRLQYPPYKDGKPGLEGSGCFAFFNDSKLGVTLDLKNPRGLELARRLAANCDAVIENMRPGVMVRIGLGYDSLKASNPGLVMLSTCNMGQTGPRADTPGFGSQLTALAGMCHLTGAPDGPPMLLYGPYIDFIASTLGAAAVLAALERRRATGKGAHLDVSQYECGLMFLAGPLLDFHLNGRVARRSGNDDPDAVLHGAYPCANGTWIAVSCWSQDEYRRLGDAIAPRPLAEWLAARDASAAAQALQAAGVHAHAVNTMADLFSDPQLAAREQWRRRTHPVIGEHSYCATAFRLAETPAEITRAAPTLGADNQSVFRDFLDLTAEEYAAYEAAGAFE